MLKLPRTFFFFNQNQEKQLSVSLAEVNVYEIDRGSMSLVRLMRSEKYQAVVPGAVLVIFG